MDSHVQKVINSGKKNLHLVTVISAQLQEEYLLLVSVAYPALEYGSEVWACNTWQTVSLEFIQLGAAKNIFGCSSKTCSEAVRGEGVWGYNLLKGRRHRCMVL